MRATTLVPPALTACAVALAASVLAASPAVAQQRVDRRIAIDADASIRVHNLVGFTRIVGWDRDSIAVTGTLPAGAGAFFMGGGGRGAKLGVEGPETSAGVPAATLEIRVPKRARLWVKGAASEIEVTGVEGELDLYSVNGRIRVEGTARQITAESIDGNIEIEGHAPFTRVKTAGGTITLRFPRGDLSVTSVSGPILVGGAAIERGRLESVSGEVSFKGTVARNGRLEVVSHSGPVELRLPPEIAAEFEINAFGGEVRNEFATGKRVKGKPVQFVTNGGGALVSVQTFKGSVTVVKQPL